MMQFDAPRSLLPRLPRASQRGSQSPRFVAEAMSPGPCQVVQSQKREPCPALDRGQPALQRLARRIGPKGALGRGFREWASPVESIRSQEAIGCLGWQFSCLGRRVRDAVHSNPHSPRALCRVGTERSAIGTKTSTAMVPRWAGDLERWQRWGSAAMGARHKSSSQRQTGKGRRAASPRRTSHHVVWQHAGSWVLTT